MAEATADGSRRSAGWFGVLVAAVGVLGFLPGALVVFLTFLRRKAQQTWGLTLALTGQGDDAPWDSMHTSDGKAPSIWKKMT